MVGEQYSSNVFDKYDLVSNASCVNPSVASDTNSLAESKFTEVDHKLLFPEYNIMPVQGVITRMTQYFCLMHLIN